MRRARWIGLLWLLLGCGIFMGWGFSVERSAPDPMGDFKVVYYGTRCLFQHCDPYKQSELENVYRREGWKIPSKSPLFRQGATVIVHLPTVFLLVTPFAMLPEGAVYGVWMIFTAGSLILAALLTWDMGAVYAPILSGCLIGFLLANSEILLGCGNTSGVLISFCVVGVWCFLKNRFVPVGVLCLAITLAVKPHDAGLVWLYFLLAGGVYRKRALQTLLITVVLGLSAFLWLSHITPHWLQNWNSNQQVLAARGNLSDPGPATVLGPDPNGEINLQTVVSVFRDNPGFYNPVSYLLCGTLLLAWSVRSIRLRFSLPGAWLALAAVVPLTMLVTYHRPYDAKLLLLTVPACAMLWAEGGLLGWCALLVNAAGFVLNGDIPLVILMTLTRSLHLFTSALFGQILTVALMRPTPIILLAMGIFYLWVYLRRALPDGEGRIADATLARG